MSTQTQPIANFFEVIKGITPRPYDPILRQWTKSDVLSGIGDSSLFRNGIIFKQYASFEDAFAEIENARETSFRVRPRWMDKAVEAVSGSQFHSLDSTLTAFNTPRSSLVQAKQMANVIVSNVQELVSLGGNYTHDRLKITEDKKGIFDFSLASQGLFRPVEFYSEKYAKAIEEKKTFNEFAVTGEPNGIILPDRVQNETNSKGEKTFFFVDREGKNWLCERRQKGTTKVYNSFPHECFLKENNQGIVLPYYIKDTDKVFNGYGKSKLKYASSQKKSYLMYEKKPESTKFVDIFIPVNFLGSPDAVRVLNTLAPILIAASLEEFGVQTRISAMRNGADSGIFNCISIPLKTYEEKTIDKIDFIFNVLGSGASAGSFFGFFKIFNGNSGEQKSETGHVLKTNDTSTSFSDIDYRTRSGAMNLFTRYKNWIAENREEPFVNTKVINSNFQFYTFQAVGKGVPFFTDVNTLSEYELLRNLGYVMFMFYYYMDFLAIEFNPMTNFVAEIMRRYEEDQSFREIFDIPKNRQAKKEMINRYINNILIEKYSYQDTGAYRDSAQQIAEKKAIFKQKVKEMREALRLI